MFLSLTCVFYRYMLNTLLVSFVKVLWLGGLRALRLVLCHAFLGIVVCSKAAFMRDDVLPHVWRPIIWLCVVLRLRRIRSPGSRVECSILVDKGRGRAGQSQDRPESPFAPAGGSAGGLRIEVRGLSAKHETEDLFSKGTQAILKKCPKEKISGAQLCWVPAFSPLGVG